MPVKVFGRTYKKFSAAVVAARRRGKRRPAAYVAAVDRAEHPRKGGGK